jgi:two-component system chemotaxis sensor kinase CheA
MDVVREHVESLHGHILVASSPGRGTAFTILIPLTLATTRAILVEQGGQIFGVPSATVERTSRVREQQFVQIDGHRTIQIEHQPIVAIELADILQLRTARSIGPKPEDWRPFFVVRQADRRVALLVDRLIGEQEVMIKSLGWPLRRVPNVSGAALLGSGQMVVILNPSDLVETGGKLPRIGRVQVKVDALDAVIQPIEVIKKRLLVVDDSLTTRALERSILEAAGYEVVVASDGVDALSILRSQSIDLVVSDVDMPRLDGFALTAEIRRDAKLRTMPIVLVTSLEAPEHRERGVAVGADAYIVKSGFDERHFLDTIGRWL